MRAALTNFFTEKHLAAAVCGLSLLLLALCAPTGAKAQVPDEPQARQEVNPQQPARGLNLMQRLNLTREQRQQLREIRRQSEPEVRAQTRRVRLARRALDEAIYADAIDDTLIEQRSRELAAAQSALIRLRATTELKVRRVLTDEQLRLFVKLRRQAQQRLLLQRRMNRTGRPAEAPLPGSPDPDAPADTQPKQSPASPPAARQRRP